MMKTVFMASIALGLAATPISSAAASDNNPQVDYEGFLRLSEELSDYRSARLVSLERFRQLAATENAIILDTRSAAAFREGHIAGAVNLPFSDFTDAKLAKVLGDKDRPILIYCNNNFRDDVVPVVKKSAQLALNIPTFASLWAYGYREVWELGELVEQTDPRLSFEGTLAEAGR